MRTAESGSAVCGTLGLCGVTLEIVSHYDQNRIILMRISLSELEIFPLDPDLVIQIRISLLGTGVQFF